MAKSKATKKAEEIVEEVPQVVEPTEEEAKIFMDGSADEPEEDIITEEVGGDEPPFMDELPEDEFKEPEGAAAPQEEVDPQEELKEDAEKEFSISEKEAELKEASEKLEEKLNADPEHAEETLKAELDKVEELEKEVTEEIKKEVEKLTPEQKKVVFDGVAFSDWWNGVSFT